MSVEAITDLDRRLLWHPYGRKGASDVGPPPLPVASAAGVRLQLMDGRELIDGMSSWWAAIHGYRHPVLDAAVTTQLGQMAHVMFGGLTHEPAVRLGELLTSITPEGLSTVFFADSGSVSVEVAIKMALQYWRAQGRDRKHRLLTWRGGYHGDTFAPMSVCDPVGGMHSLWSDILAEQIFLPAPPPTFDVEYLAQVERTLAEHRDEIAAVIVEPLVQGAGGMRFHDPALLGQLRSLCDAHDVLLIFDEIATGFGRTGHLFAADAAGVSPDIMCVGKALTGGYLTMAATLCTDQVATVISESGVGVLAHGPTFMANPLACAVSLASVQLLVDSPWQQRVSQIEAGLWSGLSDLRDRSNVVDVRVKGAIGVVELDAPVDMVATTNALVSAGVWLRPFRNLIYTMPPFICDDDDIAAICAAMTRAVDAG